MEVNSGIKLHQEPLLHFLLAGVLLFLIFDLMPQQGSDNTRSIQVGPEQLQQLIIYRNPRLDPGKAPEYLASLDEDRRNQLVEDFIKEEVMYREAVALGLNKNNYNARRRLIAQLEYINQGFIRESLAIADDELEAHYDDNRDRYFVAPKVTFTHVYFATDRSGAEEALLLAEQELVHLNESQLQFHLAGTRGHRFLYHRNYVNKEQEEVASHFSDEFARDVFALATDGVRWQGPLQSEYGYHLVLVTGLKLGYYPPLAEVYVRVNEDVTRVRIEEELDRFYREVRSTYFIDVTESAESKGAL